MGLRREHMRNARGRAWKANAGNVMAGRYSVMMKSVHQSELVRVGELLGAGRSLGEASDTASTLIALIRRGLPLSTIRRWPAALALSRREVERVLGLGARALERRTASRLTPPESERAVRVARLVARAETVFQDPAEALAWCQRPLPRLGGETPFQVMDTGEGGPATRVLLDGVERGLRRSRPAPGMAT